MADHLNEAVKFQDAMGMYREGIVTTKAEAAVCAEMEESTFVHRSLGRRSQADYHLSRRHLTAEEEEILIWRVGILGRAGFPPTPKEVTATAQCILQKRLPDAKIGSRWVNKSLYQRHPEMKARWSQLLEKVRAFKGNNVAALEQFFSTVWRRVSFAGIEVLEDKLIYFL